MRMSKSYSLTSHSYTPTNNFWGVDIKYTNYIPDFQIIRLGNYFLLSMLSIIPYSRASEDVIQ